MIALLQIALWVFALLFFFGAYPFGKVLGAIFAIIGFVLGNSVGIAHSGDASNGALLFSSIGLLVGSLLGGIKLFVEEPTAHRRTVDFPEGVNAPHSNNDVSDLDHERDTQAGALNAEENKDNTDDSPSKELIDIEEVDEEDGNPSLIELLEDEVELDEERAREVGAIVLRSFSPYKVHISNVDFDLYFSICLWILEELNDIPDIRVYQGAIEYAANCSEIWAEAYHSPCNETEEEALDNAKQKVFSYLENRGIHQHSWISS